ncbi:EamA/RhaT family transporter [Streptomyces beigongshangae]|uniref:EamA/RhaT family transporter n=1 Tax=Streptomyces beigongshangae TaxID=2841597 RepID=UPI001C840D66|nr:EamA/RhaT family transporter [Streptomyces sp. REN17]
MSEASDTPADAPAKTSTGPRPEPIRFFGTTWVDHDGGYAVRRAAVAVGALVAITAGCLVLRFAYQGLEIAAVGGFVTLLVVTMFAVCSALAFRHTWAGYSTRPAPDTRSALRGLLTIGFVGSLAAYFFRSLTEAPGEGLHRSEYETARAAYERRTARRKAKHPRKRRP